MRHRPERASLRCIALRKSYGKRSDCSEARQECVDTRQEARQTVVFAGAQELPTTKCSINDDVSYSSEKPWIRTSSLNHTSDNSSHDLQGDALTTGKGIEIHQENASAKSNAQIELDHCRRVLCLDELPTLACDVLG